jgi:hypothetical protein
MKHPDVKFTAYLHLVPPLRMSGAIPLFSLYTIRAWARTTLLYPLVVGKVVK